jgi:hypothetical protein
VLETHPKTGAAQLVEIRETVKEVLVPVYVQTELPLAATGLAEKPALFANTSDDELLNRMAPRCQKSHRGHAADLDRPPPRRGG